ncbi:hypothetical protein SUGI_0170410 [Cryptomeria japonica]|nr:hypothetical protein SUGI_0170410 [Cryptomeria japonica]
MPLHSSVDPILMGTKYVCFQNPNNLPPGGRGSIKATREYRKTLNDRWLSSASVKPLFPSKGKENKPIHPRPLKSNPYAPSTPLSSNNPNRVVPNPVAAPPSASLSIVKKPLTKQFNLDLELLRPHLDFYQNKSIITHYLGNGVAFPELKEWWKIRFHNKLGQYQSTSGGISIRGGGECDCFFIRLITPNGTWTIHPTIFNGLIDSLDIVPARGQPSSPQKASKVNHGKNALGGNPRPSNPKPYLSLVDHSPNSTKVAVVNQAFPHQPKETTIQRPMVANGTCSNPTLKSPLNIQSSTTGSSSSTSPSHSSSPPFSRSKSKKHNMTQPSSTSKSLEKHKPSSTNACSAFTHKPNNLSSSSILEKSYPLPLELCASQQ